MRAWCFDWTGNAWVRVIYNFKVEEYEREREIEALPCFPFRYFNDANHNTPEQFRALAIQSGIKFKLFCELQGAARMIRYDDIAITVGKTRTNTLITVILPLIPENSLLIKPYRLTT
jgi:hypothetical protein